MKKLLLWAAAGIAGLVVVLALVRNPIARRSVELGAERITGFPLTIGAVNVGLFNGQLDVENLKLMNPPDFEERQFVSLPKLHVDYRLRSMLARAPHINDMLIDIDHIVIVKNSKGDSNTQKLKSVTSSGSGGSGKSSTRYRLDQLRIHVGTVTMKDYSRAKPSERNVPLNVTAVYKDITDSTDITRLVLLTMMSQAKLPDIGIKPDELRKGLSNVENLAGEAGKSVLDTLKEVAPQK